MYGSLYHWCAFNDKLVSLECVFNINLISLISYSVNRRTTQWIDTWLSVSSHDPVHYHMTQCIITQLNGQSLTDARVIDHWLPDWSKLPDCLNHCTLDDCPTDWPLTDCLTESLTAQWVNWPPNRLPDHSSNWPSLQRLTCWWHC